MRDSVRQVISYSLVIGIMAGATLGALGMRLWDLRKPATATEARPRELYPPVDFAEVADGKFKRPRASIVGEVKEVRREADGDWHITLADGGKLVVLEIIPELHFAPPKKGDKIRAWGIVREDLFHGWFELHPLVGWEKVE